MKKAAFFSLILFYIFIIPAGGQSINPAVETSADAAITIYLVSRGYHTGLVIPIRPASSIIKVLNSYTAGYAEFGWGEAHYYQVQNPGCIDAPLALLTPNRSVIRLELLPSGPGYSLSRSSFAIKFILTDRQFSSMCLFIQNSFSEKGSGPIIESSERGGMVIYYSSMNTYHLFNTCNTWAAKALASGGVEISPPGTILAHQLYQKVKDKGTIIKN